MTTPNNQPTPPPGMEILTDYTKPLPDPCYVWFGDIYPESPEKWRLIAPIGIRTDSVPDKNAIYAIPITHPATGDTTNEKGGEPCHDPATGAADVALGVKKPADVASNAASEVRSVEQRQELLPCPFCGEPPKSYPLTGRVSCVNLRCPMVQSERFGGQMDKTEWNTRK